MLSAVLSIVEVAAVTRCSVLAQAIRMQAHLFDASAELIVHVDAKKLRAVSVACHASLKSLIEIRAQGQWHGCIVS